MLPKSLIISRYRQGKIFPFKLSFTNANSILVKNLIDLFKHSIGKSRIEIEEELKEITIENPNPKIAQGIADILFKRSQFTAPTHEDPQKLREFVFSASAAYWKNLKSKPSHFRKSKSEILEKIAPKDQNLINHTELTLFGDIPSNQSMVQFEEITVEDLIHKYNLEQVQGLLLDAQNLELRIHRPNNLLFRQMMQMLKFFQLMYDIQQSDDTWLVLKIDGPASILDSARSYGLELALFFPYIALLKAPWYLTANIKQSQPGRTSSLALSYENDYHCPHPEKRVWINTRIGELVDRLNKKYPEEVTATVSQTIIPLAQNKYLIPDFKVNLTSADSKTDYLVEWIPYQSKWKMQWLKTVLSEIPQNYVFAFRGKAGIYKELSKRMENHCLVYTSELTAPKIKKRLETLQKEKH